MRSYKNGANRFLDFLRALVVGPNDYSSSIGPQVASSTGGIAAASNANCDINWSRAWYPELADGYYQVHASAILRMADNTFREVRFAFSALWIEPVPPATTPGLALQATPTALSGGWNSAGVTVTVSVAGSSNNLLRFNIANASGQNVVSGDVYLSFGRRLY